MEADKKSGVFQRCSAIAHVSGERCKCRRGNLLVSEGEADWLCPAHFKEAVVKANTPPPPAGSKCCGNNKRFCRHDVVRTVGIHFFCDFHSSFWLTRRGKGAHCSIKPGHSKTCPLLLQSQVAQAPSGEEEKD